MRQHHDGNGDHGIVQARTQHGDDGNCQQQARQGQQDVHHAHDQRIDQAAEKAGQQTEQNPRRQRQRYHDAANQQRDPRPEQQARQQIAANVIGTEWKAPTAAVEPGRRQQQCIAVLLSRRMRRQPWRTQRHHQQNGNHQQAGNRAGVLAKMTPELAQRTRWGQGKRMLSHG